MNCPSARNILPNRITLVQARQAARALCIARAQLSVSLRRAKLEEARSTIRPRRELGADDRDYVYSAGEVSGRNPALVAAV